jgi:two-component system LytT family sensor kinase
MKPQKGNLVKWLGIWAMWTLVALYFASQLALQNQVSDRPIPFWRILSWQLVSGYIWFAFTPLILWLSSRYSFEGSRWKIALPVHLFASVVIAAVQLAIGAFILPKLGYLERFQLASFADTFRVFLFVNLHFSIAIYWGVVAIHQAIRYYRKFRERELQTSQLEARLAQSRLQVLKMQLHPHFLFNTLNAISELVHRDPEAADRMLTDLSDLLRMSFENLEMQEVPLEKELEFLRKYLEIEQMRFHDRLVVDLDIAEATLEASVPNMILQPIVENAIKHGISPRAEGGRIAISAERSNGSLSITVEDDGLGISGNMQDIREGVGISNTRKRLRHLYGDQQQFDLSASNSGGVMVRIDMPFRVTNEGSL